MLFLFLPNGLNRLNRWLMATLLSGFADGASDLLKSLNKQL